MSEPGQWFESNPLWFKTAVFYEIHTRAFFDGNDDGSGDFRGLGQKLDYLQWLGIDCIWLLPFYPSPLRDGGYDIADFYGINADYGTVEDFRAFVEAAHERGMRVIVDLVMNHTSSDHPWFQESREAPDGPKGDWYVWSDTPDPYPDARIIFVDTEASNWTFDPVRGQYYWHRFFSHQPDLNYESPEVQEAMLDVLRFWLDLGLDGFRLDAVPYLFEQEGTNCENLPATHEYLKRVRAEVDARYADRILLAEANQWPEDVVEYFGEGDGDECHMAFHFPVMPRMFMALRREEALPMIEILDRTPPIPASAQWGLFLRNHDELTLEMVTDDERDYMYGEYAKDPRMKLNVGIRRRLAPLLDNGRDEIELMHAILFSLPGAPVLYYGDEIAMGDNVYLGDRDGVRTPMQWTGDRNGGFSRADFAQLYLPPLMDPVYGFNAVNVEAQLRTPTSLLRWLRRFIELRKQHPVFGLGDYHVLRPENPKIFAHIRSFSEDIVLCVHNLARSAQAVELDLSAFEGRVPVELFGNTEFPRIGEWPYLLTLGPRGFFWFQLQDPPMSSNLQTRIETGDLHFLDGLVLLGTIASQRWFGGKSRDVLDARVLDAGVAPGGPPVLAFCIVEVRYGLQSHDLYHLPLGFRPADEGWNRSVIAEPDGWTVYDAIDDPHLVREIVGLMRSGTTLHLENAAIVFWGATGLTERTGELGEVRPMGAEQTNSSVVIDETLALKLYRRIEPGVNPELELLRFLSDRGFEHIATLEGYAAYEGRPLETTLAIMQRYIPAHGDGWELALDTIVEDPGWMPTQVRRLGEVTGLLHNALASDATDPHFAPEEPSGEALALLSASIDEEIEQVFATLPASDELAPIAGRGEEVRDHLRALTHIGNVGKVIRTHGDYHLGQALWTEEEDWVILDFEGEPARSVPERRRKRSPLRDVAGMLRSFAYAASAAQLQRGATPPETWEDDCRRSFLEGYLATIDPVLLPAGEQAIDRLLTVFELEKAVYELRYELGNRPDWVGIPVAGILRMLEREW